MTSKKAIYSMTGFASASKETTAVQINLELRGVNSRFLDVQCRIAEEARHCEPFLRSLFTQRIARGKVECRLSVKSHPSLAPSLVLNTEILQQLTQLQTQLHVWMPQAQPLCSSEILHWPGVLQDTSLSAEALLTEVQEVAQQALEQFQNTRQREGEKLKAILLEQVQFMESTVARIAPLMPKIVLMHQQKLTERMMAAFEGANTLSHAPDNLGEVTERIAERIRQEATLFGMRIDVAEELARLGAHLEETRHMLEVGGSVGKRLDFMMQELNREANTLASKAVAKELTDAAMALKLSIEQMREQVQNLE